MKKFLSFVIVLSIGVSGLIACDTKKGGTTFIPFGGSSKNVLSVILNKNSTAMLVGATEQLTATIIPADAVNQNVSWETSDELVASVSGTGLVTAEGPGTADITVTTEDGDYTATCRVTVTTAPVSVTGVSLNKINTSITIGNTEQLTATIDPVAATNQNLSWLSTNETVATVSSSGLITAVAEGSASIIVISDDGSFTDSCAVTVPAAPVSVTGVTVSKSSTSILEGGTEQIWAIISPANATNQNVTWESDDTLIASVNTGGNITAEGVGVTTITATTADGGFTAVCEVTVTPIPIDVTGVSLNKSSTTLTVGGNEQLTSTIDPVDATNQNVTWMSTDISVATVSSGGLIAAVAPGTASIVVITRDGLFTDSCMVTVNDATIPGEVSSLKAATGDERITLNWTDPSDTDFSHVEITWTPGGTSPITVAKGNQTYMVIGLQNSTEYTFTVKAVDLYGNKSAGAIAIETPYNIREGLVGEWLFNGNASDTSGYGHNGTVTGAVLSNDRFNNSNKSYYFDGTNDRIDLGTFFTLHTFTISLWVKNTSISGDYSAIIDNNHDFTNRWCLQVHPNSYEYDFGGVYPSIQNNQWTHIVLIEEENDYSIYVNGTFVGTNHFVGTDDGNQHLVLGYWYGAAMRWYQGYIDDIRAYNRVLSTTEIKALYHENGWDSNKQSYSADGINFKMAYAPAKTFMTGTDDSGTASVANSFWIGDSEVTYELWYKVHAWAVTDAGGGLRVDGGPLYSFANPGREGHDGTITDPAGASPTNARFEPVTTINWRDAMIWCNAATEWYNAENGTTYSCVYYSDSSYTTPIRDSSDGAYGSSANGTAGSFDNPYVNANATGFRLLSGNEWELAARYIEDANDDGDISDVGEYYPGNYASGAAADYSNIPATNIVAWWSPNAGSATHDVMGRLNNGLGLYDVSGNVHEWCFDWTTPGAIRMIRGGSWNGSIDVHVGYVGIYSPWDENYNIGFRIGKNQ